MNWLVEMERRVRLSLMAKGLPPPPALAERFYDTITAGKPDELEQHSFVWPGMLGIRREDLLL